MPKLAARARHSRGAGGDGSAEAMGHVPHVFVPSPWNGGRIAVAGPTRHHLETVLRVEDGDPISYTDGAGIRGRGVYRDGIERGSEQAEPPTTPALTLASAPPKSRDRTRILVEKLAELGVDRLIWLRTRHSTASVPNSGKARAWAIAALEQSRGAHLMAVDGPSTLTGVAAAHPGLLVADPGPGSFPMPPLGTEPQVTVAVGPEGGFAPDEIPDGVSRVSLGRRILRIETAAVVVAARILAPVGTPSSPL